jgi:hypothetical protein
MGDDVVMAGLFPSRSRFAFAPLAGTALCGRKAAFTSPTPGVRVAQYLQGHSVGLGTATGLDVFNSKRIEQ